MIKRGYQQNLRKSEWNIRSRTQRTREGGKEGGAEGGGQGGRRDPWIPLYIQEAAVVEKLLLLPYFKSAPRLISYSKPPRIACIRKLYEVFESKGQLRTDFQLGVFKI